MNRIIETYNKNETYNFAMNLASKCKGGEVFCLDGDLGVGKTVFAKGFAKGLNIIDDISSPTFAIVNEYIGSELNLYHFDVYRINNTNELFEIGYYEYVNDYKSVCLIEWGSIILDELPKGTKFVKISKDLNIDENYRRIEIYEDISN